MRKYVVLTLVAAAFGTGCQSAADRFDPHEIIALERERGRPGVCARRILGDVDQRDDKATGDP